MSKQTQAEIIHDMRLLMGLNTDGTRNGNGLLNDVKTLKVNVENIDKKLISIDSKLEKRLEENIKIANDIKQIKENLNDKIGIKNISNLHKIIILTTALTGILMGVLSFFITLTRYFKQ